MNKTKTSKMIIATVIIAAIILSALLIFGLLKDNQIIANDTFSNNSTVNGVNVSGLNYDEAANMISSKMLKEKSNIEIKLNYKEKSWMLNGNDFALNSNLKPEIKTQFQNYQTKKISSLRKKPVTHTISYRQMFSNFDEKLDEIAKDINVAPVDSKICFDPNAEEMFTVCQGQAGYEIDKEKLLNTIDKEFKNAKKISVEIPVKTVDYTNDVNLLENTKLRSKFSTSYASSAVGRKNNVKRALQDFNGMSIAPGEEISFNVITGDKTPEKGYKKANVILNGIYVEDYGGGACQASTTLYNALLLADLEILEVHPHSLPVSYVPLAFDAMVNEGTSDMRFKNNTNHAIFIKTYGDEENAYVEIYGEGLEDGVEIKRRAEFIETIPHEGDTIVKDVEGKYADKITYEGEYLRIKKPQEGYHSKAYLQYFKNGELVSEKLIRDEIYQPQKGIIMEGTEPLGEGMTLPENTVEIIPPQMKKNNVSEIAVKKKIDYENPSNLNP